MLKRIGRASGLRALTTSVAQAPRQRGFWDPVAYLFSWSAGRGPSDTSSPWKNSFTAVSRLKHPSSRASQPHCYGRRGAGRYFFNGLLGVVVVR